MRQLRSGRKPSSSSSSEIAVFSLHLGDRKVQKKTDKAKREGGKKSEKKEERSVVARMGESGTSAAAALILGSASAHPFGFYRPRSLLESRPEICLLPHKCSNCDQNGAKGLLTARWNAHGEKKKNRFVSALSTLLFLQSFTWRVLVTELVPPPGREVAELL